MDYRTRSSRSALGSIGSGMRGSGGGGVGGAGEIFRLRNRILLVYFQAVLMDSTGYFLAMISDGQVYVVNEGETAILECQFHADHYNLFDYPVLWQKVQGASEETQVNIMSNINDPFLHTNRYEVTFTDTPPRFKFELTILDVSPVDSGNYTCQVRGQHSVILGQLTNALYVRAQIDRLFVYENDAGGDPSSPSSSSSEDLGLSHKTFRLVEGRPGRLGCSVTGGFPPPSIELYIGQRDVTALFALTSVVSLVGERGLRTIRHWTRRSTVAYLPVAEDDEDTLKCIASVQGLEPLIDYAMLDVAYSPKIRCQPSSASVGDRNVDIRCEISAKPQTSKVFWLIDENGTTLTDGHDTQTFWTVLTDRTDGVSESQLYFTHVTPIVFRRFSIVAENVVGITTEDVELTQKFRKEPKEPLADASVSHDVSSRTTSRNETTNRAQGFRKKSLSGRKPTASKSQNSMVTWMYILASMLTSLNHLQ